MKGIIKYNKKFYKRSKDTTVVKGDLVKLECERKSPYFKFNGIYEAMDTRYIHIKNYDAEGIPLCLKLGYNIGYRDFSKLVEVKKNSLPMPAKEEEMCGYTI